MKQNKPLIISGFGGVGKSTLARKYKNVIDLESSAHQWIVDPKVGNGENIKASLNREKNPDYPNNYIQAIKDAMKKYDVICVMYNGTKDPNFLDQFNYVVCYPTKRAFNNHYIRRYRERGNTEEFIEVIKRYYAVCYEKSKNITNKIVLRDDETLEDALIKRGIELIPREVEDKAEL